MKTSLGRMYNCGNYSNGKMDQDIYIKATQDISLDIT